MTTSEAAGGSATTDVMVMLRAAGKKAFFPSTNPATGWWQDSAGTTQAALEQPVGRITDLSGNNYHATQATSLNRPTYTQRVNLLQRTEAFDNAAWVKGANVTITANSHVAPDGATTADTYATTGGGADDMYQTFSNAAGVDFTVVIHLKYINATWLRFVLSDGGGTNQCRVWVNLLSGTLGTSSAGGTATLVSTSITVLANGYYRVTLRGTQPGATGYVVLTHVTADASTTRAAGSSVVWGCDCRLSAFSAMNLPAYQRVGNGAAGVADYDTAGFRPMLYFDGTSDALATSAIDLTGTDQIMALCNVLKVSDAATGVVYELSTTVSTPGTFYFAAPRAVNTNYGGASTGTGVPVVIDYTNAAVAAPNLACLRLDADISTPIVTLRRNGTQIATSSGVQGARNYSSNPLYIGARAGTSLWFKGYMIPGPLLDTTGIPAALLDQMAREQAALWGVAI
jgi:hypothetical protein